MPVVLMVLSQRKEYSGDQLSLKIRILNMALLLHSYLNKVLLLDYLFQAKLLSILKPCR